MVVPLDKHNYYVGTSPDYDEGPIIPNDLYSDDTSTVLLSSTEIFRNGALFDDAFDMGLLRLDKIDPPFEVDGHSHIPVFLVAAADWGAPGKIEGSYFIHSKLLDHDGNGWHITTRFKIKKASDDDDD